MIGRVIRPVGNVLRAVWGATAGRLFAGDPRAEARSRLPVAERVEPRGVAGITFRASLVVVGVVLAAYLVYQLRLLLILIFLAVLLAAGLYGVVRWFERMLPRIFAVLLAYIGLVAAFGLVLFLIFPPLIRQAVTFAEDLPEIGASLRTTAVDLLSGLVGPGQGEEIIDTLTSGAQDAAPELGSLVGIPLTLAGILTNLLIVVLLSALMLIERDRVRRWVLEFIDDADHEVAVGVGRAALLRLGAYVRGQLLVMTLIGVGSAAGMLAVGMFTTGEPLPFAVPLGALSFITAAIPMAGAFIAGGPIVLIALTVSPLAALLMAGWLIVLQQLEGSIITPFIQGKVVSLSAIAVLLGVVAGTSIAGIVGGIIAIPLVAVADVVLRDVVFPLRKRAAERRAARLAGQESPAL